MERFISTKLFRSLQKAAQKGSNMSIAAWEKQFAAFAQSVFSEGATATDRIAYFNSLVYTRVALPGLTEVSKKKCGNLFEKSYWFD